MTGIQQLLVLRCCCGCCGVRGPLTIVVACGWRRVRLPLTIVERSLVLVVLNISRSVLDMGVGHIRSSRVLGWIVAVLVVSWGIVSKALAYDNTEIKYAI